MLGSVSYFARLCGLAPLREPTSSNKGDFTQSRKVAKDRKGKTDATAQIRLGSFQTDRRVECLTIFNAQAH